MATLDDAAEALVIKLRGLDSEIEESEQKLEELRAQIEASSGEVDQEWMALTEAVSSFLDKVREEHDRLGQEIQQALQAAGDAGQAVATAGAEARSEVADGRAQLDTLAQHATGMEPGVEALAAEAGESPAQSLAQRAAQVEQELVQALDEARDFLRDEVVQGVEDLAQDIRDRCQALRNTLADEYTAGLQATFDDWESKVDELEQYVQTQGFLASHGHAHDVVEYALGKCQTAFAEQLDQVRQVVEVLDGQVQELASEAQRTIQAAVEQTGADLAAGLDGTRDAVTSAVSALGSVRELLASYSFVAV